MGLTTVRTLLRFIRPCSWALPVLIVLGVLASFAEGLGIGLLIPFIDAIMRGDPDPASTGLLVRLVRRYATQFDPAAQPMVLGATIVALVALKAGALYLSGALSSVLNGRVSHGLRVALMRKALTGEYRDVLRGNPGRLLNVIKFQTWKTADAVFYFIALLIAGCTAAVFGVLLLLISWQLTLGVMAGMLLVQGVVILLGRRAERLGRVAVRADHALVERLSDVLHSMRTVRAFGQEEAEERRFAAGSEQVRQAFQRSELIATAVHPLLELFLVPLFLGVLFLAWRLDVGLATVMAFLLLLYRLQPHLKTLHESHVQLSADAGAVADVAAQLDQPVPPDAWRGGRRFEGLRQGIAFQDVHFRYGADGDAAVLRGVSFAVRRGEVAALVGPSGTGKSTIVNLLYGFYRPTEGAITVDGQPLGDLDPASWRSRLAIAGQDADLLGETVAEAIAFGRQGASRAEVEAAARLAGAHPFITALPGGYDAPIGGRGGLLSGGQRQRLALARALLRKPDTLILDEATNALDVAAEQDFHDVLQRLAGTLTIIVIAHRASAVRGADRVVVLEGGQVVEEGRAADLMTSGSRYARLCGGPRGG